MKSTDVGTCGWGGGGGGGGGLGGGGGGMAGGGGIDKLSPLHIAGAHNIGQVRYQYFT